MRNPLQIAPLLLATWFTGASAQEASTTLHSTVSGNQEQPRVMYIVPWQRPEAAAFDYELENRLAEELFSVVDRDEFVRGLNYSDALNAPPNGATDDIDSNNSN